MALNYGCAFAHFDCFAIFFLTFQKLLWIESTILLIPLIMIHCQKKSHRCPPYCWTAVSLLWIILPEASFTSFGHLESLDISDRGSEEVSMFIYSTAQVSTSGGSQAISSISVKSPRIQVALLSVELFCCQKGERVGKKMLLSSMNSSYPCKLTLLNGTFAPKHIVPSSLSKFTMLMTHIPDTMALPQRFKIARSWDKRMPVNRCQCFSFPIFSLPVITTIIILFLGDRNPCTETRVLLSARDISEGRGSGRLKRFCAALYSQRNLVDVTRQNHVSQSRLQPRLEYWRKNPNAPDKRKANR
uniref:uncharacterized protein LOC103792246 isoform X2 n=1 Tax=Callithrix jacchus TaxID=9483 RepID=UPI00159DA007|nr:uncharacterized protein LOC103792246 isoform X2 [Callithrix jacchus]